MKITPLFAVIICAVAIVGVWLQPDGSMELAFWVASIPAICMIILWLATPKFKKWEQQHSEVIIAAEWDGNEILPYVALWEWSDKEKKTIYRWKEDWNWERYKRERGDVYRIILRDK